MRGDIISGCGGNYSPSNDRTSCACCEHDWQRTLCQLSHSLTCKCDKTSSCPPSGSSKCEYFISELKCAIETFREEWTPPASIIPDDTEVFLEFLAYYYSGIPWNIKGPIWRAGLPQPVRGGQPPEKYPMPFGEDGQEVAGQNLWREFLPTVSSRAQATWPTYGFRRPYWGNTHHYFVYLNLFYTIPDDGLVKHQNVNREIQDLKKPYDDWQKAIGGSEEKNQEMYYAWLYQESIYDLYITEHASKVANIVAKKGIESLPDEIEKEFCATSSADVWSLEQKVAQYYFDLNLYLLPPYDYWIKGTTP